MVFQGKQQRVHLELTFYLAFHQLNIAPLIVGIFKLKMLMSKYCLHLCCIIYIGSLQTNKKKTYGIRSICIMVHIASISTSTQEPVQNSK